MNNFIIAFLFVAGFLLLVRFGALVGIVVALLIFVVLLNYTDLWRTVVDPAIVETIRHSLHN